VSSLKNLAGAGLKPSTPYESFSNADSLCFKHHCPDKHGLDIHPQISRDNITQIGRFRRNLSKNVELDQGMPEDPNDKNRIHSFEEINLVDPFPESSATDDEMSKLAKGRNKKQS